MGYGALGESIILQSLEDLTSAEHRQESVRFFMGEGFRISAKIAGLDVRVKEKIISLFILMSSTSRYTPRPVRAAGGAQRRTTNSGPDSSSIPKQTAPGW